MTGPGQEGSSVGARIQISGWGTPKPNLPLVRSYLVCCPKLPKEDLGQGPKKDQRWEELSWYGMGLTTSLKFWEVAVFTL